MSKQKVSSKSSVRITGDMHQLVGPKRKQYVIWGLSFLFALLLVGIGYWTMHAVRESLRTMYTEKLRTILEADVAALEMWANNEMSYVDSWTQDSELREKIQNLLEISQISDDRDVLLSSPDLQGIRSILTSVIEDGDYEGFVIVNRFGRIVATDGSDNDTIGKIVTPEAMETFVGVNQGKAQMCKPFKKSRFISEYVGDPDALTMVVVAPVYNDNNEVIAGLAFKINPERDFTRVLNIANVGETGETYAFDKSGVMLSDSRFEEQLKSVGLLDQDDTSILNVQVRDPGGNLLKGYKTDIPLAARPLTRMAASAIMGEPGINISGYRDYRGVEVIGAWKWLSKADMGVVTEIDVAEAFGVLRPLKRAFIWLFGLLIASAIGIIFSTYNVNLLRQRIKEVKRLGQYTLEERIGEGGIGIVYKARHVMLQRPTALKMLKKESISSEAIARFEREVQLTSQLTHPNTIEIYDYGRTPDGVFYYVMEYLQGINLAQLIDIDQDIPPARVIHIIKQVCGSLEEAHGIGLVHRDIKPLNILLCQRGLQSDVVKVLDFGLVKDISLPVNLQVTIDTEVVSGTPLYIAPERLKDPQDCDARSDIYSLGVVMFNLLTGRDIFKGLNVVDICNQVMNATPPRPSMVATHPIPDKLDKLVFDCIAKKPEDRPGSVSDIIEILNSTEEIERWTQKNARYWWAQNSNRIGAASRTSLTTPITEKKSDSTVAVDFRKKPF